MCLPLAHWRKLKLLFWKELIIMKAQKYLVGAEILLPIIIFSSYLFLEQYIDDYVTKQTTINTFTPSDSFAIYRNHATVCGPDTIDVCRRLSKFSKTPIRNYEGFLSALNEKANVIGIYFWDNTSFRNSSNNDNLENIWNLAEQLNDMHKGTENYNSYVHNPRSKDFEPNTLIIANLFKISYAFLILLVKKILDERINGIHSMILVCSIPEYLVWMGYFLAAVSKCLFTTAIIAVILSGSYSCPWLLMWIFMMVILINGIMMALMCSLITDTALVNILAFVFLWFVTYDVGETIDPEHKEQFATWCIHPGLALFQGFNVIYNTYGKSEKPIFLNLTVLFAMLLLDICWLTLLTAFLVFNRNRRNNLTVYFHPYMLLQPQVMGGVMSEETEARKRNYESVDESTPVSIRLRNLRKVYTFGFENTVAVIDGITMDIYSNITTILLGENAAGKTTLLNMLLNLLKPTSGTVDGQGPFGYCSQENIFYPSVPVIEQLIIFGVLKGLDIEQATLDAYDLVQELNMTKFAYSFPKNIPGNIKRKLSFALAIVGRPNTILLDEPTTGLSPTVKKDIWNVLLKLNGTRTIILSTHYLLEAELLGDRIAILDCGVVQCYGTPKFLKKLYGTGYTLKVVKSINGDVDMISDAIKKIIPGAAMTSKFRHTLTFSLPYDEIDRFSTLFDVLEANQDFLGITGIKVTRTTLEEVFLKVLDIEVKDLCLPGDWPSESRLPKGRQLKFQQFFALLKKKLLYMRYNSKPYLVIFTFFVLFYLILTVLITKSKPSVYKNLSFNYSLTPKIFQDIRPSIGETKKDPSRFEDNLINYTVNVNIQLQNLNETSIYVNILPLKKQGKNSSRLPFWRIIQRFNYGKHFPLSVISLRNGTNAIVHEDTELWFIVIPLMFAFVSPMAVLLPLYERQTGFRHQLTLSGMGSFVYWSSNFVGDTILSIIFSIFISVIMQCHNTHPTNHAFVQLFLMLFMYSSFSCILGYLISQIILSTLGAIVIILIISFACMIVPLSYQIRENIVDKINDENTMRLLRKIASFIPPLVFSSFTPNSTVDIRTNCMNGSNYLKLDCNQATKDAGVDFICRQLLCRTGLFETHSTTTALFMRGQLHESSDILYILFLIIFLILLFLNFCFLRSRREYIERIPVLTGTDVLNEESMVNRFLERREDTTKQYDVIAYHIQKKIKKIDAVKSVTFGVAQNECFGLLGANYSGKSKVISVMAGAERSYGGEAFVYKYNLREDKDNYLNCISYCPGYCALNEALTGLETLQLVADILGIQKKKRKSYILFFIQLFSLEYDAHSTVSMYNRGTRRKLSLAVILMSGASIILLQDLTTGLDIITRKLLWLIVLYMQKKGCTIIITGHDSSECEKLCTRVGIMHNGQLTHIGTVPYLKQRYGKGYKIICKLRQVDGMSDARRELKKDIERFMDVHLVDDHRGFLTYRVVDQTIKWSDMFTILQSVKNTHKVLAEYSLSECTLNDIYLSLEEMRVSKRANMQQLVKLRQKLNKGNKASLTSLV